MHVEQEVMGNDTTALDSVRQCDTKRAELLAEEAAISAEVQSSR